MRWQRILCNTSLRGTKKSIGTRTTDTQWRQKSKISEKLGRCVRQNMLRLYLKIWEWKWIFGRAVKTISSLGLRIPCLQGWYGIGGLSNFQGEYTKLDWIFAQNQQSQRISIIIVFVNDKHSAMLSKSAKIRFSMSIFNVKNHLNLFEKKINSINFGAYFLFLTIFKTCTYS